MSSHRPGSGVPEGDSRWQTVKEVFDLALDVPESSRQALVNALTADPGIQEEVFRLLTAWVGAQSWFDQAGRSVLALNSVPTLDSGDVIAGRYRVKRFIARGGIGEVYEAEDNLLSGLVALKILQPFIARQPGIEGRFRKEIQLSRAIKSPYVCRVHDIETHRANGSEMTFYTMELLSGETLASRLKNHRSFTLAEARPLIRGMALGLETAHCAGVLHRDFKPSNVVLTPTGPVITDFGLAHELLSTIDAQTGATPAYASPEQLTGRKQPLPQMFIRSA